MSIRVGELMAPVVFVAGPEDPVSHVRDLMQKRGIHAVPVLDAEGRPVGIVTAGDLVERLPDRTPVSRVMRRELHSVGREDPASVAARIMRAHGLHHLLVTEQEEILGILSSFDLLRVVEEHRFVRRDTGNG